MGSCLFKNRMILDITKLIGCCLNDACRLDSTIQSCFAVYGALIAGHGQIDVKAEILVVAARPGKFDFASPEPPERQRGFGPVPMSWYAFAKPRQRSLPPPPIDTSLQHLDLAIATSGKMRKREASTSQNSCHRGCRLSL